MNDSRNNNFQDWAIWLLTEILKNSNPEQNLEDHGYKYSLKNGVVCHYANMYWNGEEYINMWQTNFNNKRFSGAENALLMSTEAYKIVKEIKEGKRKLRDENNKYILHWEHITPNGVVYDRLNSIKKGEVNDDKIKECFRHHKLILITKEEAKFLDGKEHGLFTNKDSELLEEWKKSRKAVDEDVNSIRDEKNNFLKCKNHGSGLARIAHLLNKEVEFTMYKDSKYDIDKILKYLEKYDFSYEKTND